MSLSPITERKAQIGWDVRAALQPDALDQYRDGFDDLYQVSDVSGGATAFFNRADSVRFDDMVIGVGASVGQTLSRGPGEVRRSGLDAISVILDRSGMVGDADGTDVRGGAGSIHFRDLARPSASRPERIDVINLMLPRSRMPDALLVGGLHGLCLSADMPGGRLLGQHLTLLAELAPRLSADEGVAGIEAALVLMQATVGALPGMDAAPAQAAYRTVRAMATGLIDARLLEADLSPDVIARTLGLSRATLYRAFEREGGVRAHLQRHRLDHARQALRARRGRSPSISQIAWTHGFTSDAHFTRAFRARFGMAPSDVGRGAGRLEGTVHRSASARHDVLVDWVRGG